MKTAFSVWNNRIAPVFDVSRQILLAETKGGRIIIESRETLADTIPEQKATHLAELDVGILVCGAVSRPLQEMISAYGIRVIPFLVRRHVRSH
jgi:predicted Fe-Mo cluster-binding NifX family protein